MARHRKCSSFIFVSISIDSSVENNCFGKQSEQFSMNLGIILVFKIYSKLIKYSKWRPPFAK